MTNPDEYFQYRVSSKFVAEIQIVFSIIVLVSAIISGVSFYSTLKNADGLERDMAIGYLTFSVLTTFVAITDIFCALILISATSKISLGRSLLWRGSAYATLGTFGLLTLAFTSMLRSATVVLGYFPTLIFKPFAIWIVSGFIDELRQLENFPSHRNSISLPPAKPTLSLQNPKQIKRKTTIFKRESVIGSRITTIPEETVVH